jgi:hypothetical protein
VIAIAGCQPSAPIHTPARPVPAVAGSLEPIPWSARRLTWSDFRAQPTVGTGAAAVTATTITSRMACLGEAFGFEVAALFYPDRSWVNHSLFVQLGSDRWALQHEQTHFDITEVHARRMRQFLTTLARPCDRTERQLGEILERFMDDVESAQTSYDRDTLNGRDGGAQLRWDDDVQRTLESLAGFEGGSVPGR